MAKCSDLRDNILAKAIKVALASTSQFKVGAVTLSKRKVISYSCNFDRRTHPVQLKWAHEAAKVHDKELVNKLSLHAEIGALIKAKGRADTIVICRVCRLPGVELKYSRPCPVCSGFIRDSGIKHVHYSTESGFKYEYWG